VPGLTSPTPDPAEDKLTRPVLTKRVLPRFPEDARTSGSVTVRMLVSKEGKPGSFDIVASTAPNFEKAALEAIKNWEYTPFLRNGIPSEVDMTIGITFRPKPLTPQNGVLVSVHEHISDTTDR
jgi:TonB family protein